jgi:membrane fusion protein, copper/silver efflux system
LIKLKKMKTSKLLVVILAILLIAASCSNSSKSTDNQNSVQSESVAVSYTCPMHPEVKSNTPGDCPVCGMKLVEVTSIESDTTSQL